MIKSMTGFGRSEMATETQKVIVEIKSVNHRYCDLNIKMPKKLSFFESNIRNLLKEYIQRGKVDIYISYEDYTEAKECVRYRKEIAKEYGGESHAMESGCRLKKKKKVDEMIKALDKVCEDYQEASK